MVKREEMLDFCNVIIKYIVVYIDTINAYLKIINFPLKKKRSVHSLDLRAP